MTVHDDIELIRGRLVAAGGQFQALTALDRLEASLPKPVFEEEGFYLYSNSGVFWTDGTGKWWDVTMGYRETDYPTHLKPEELMRLYRADEVASLA